MIAGYPVLLFVPGLLFIVAGIWMRRRAAVLDSGSDLGKRLAAANRTSSTVSIIFGVTMAILAIPLLVVWHQVQ
ncbi:MAG TPA: hypothetical protein VNL71_18190 [Chloroflexota bacterium]|nr:hypothetical protein [Chloroflexota bacterium]